MINVIFAKGFEEIEALSVVDMLRRADIEVIMVSSNGELSVTGSHNITVKCDKTIEQAEIGDGIVLPGGIPGVPNIEKSRGSLSLIKKHYEQNKLVAAICAAPTILESLGILSGKKAICYPSKVDSLISADIVDEDVVTDKNIITSRSAGTALDFAFEIIKYIKDEVTADNVKKSIIYRQ